MIDLGRETHTSGKSRVMVGHPDFSTKMAKREVGASEGMIKNQTK